MFEQVAPLRSYIRQQAPCGRLGITSSIAEKCCGSRFIESDTGPRAIPQRVIFASATLNHGPGSTVRHETIMLLFGLDNNHWTSPSATGLGRALYQLASGAAPGPGYFPQDYSALAVNG